MNSSSSYDSALDSQRFFSQSNSQMSTQDLFTSRTVPGSGSQSEKSDKMSMYEKWLKKRSLLKHHSMPAENKVGSMMASSTYSVNGNNINNKVEMSKPNLFTNAYKDFDGSNKTFIGPTPSQLSLKEKAYERDIRDLLKQVLLYLEESGNEMKQCASDSSERLEKLGDLVKTENKQTSSSITDVYKNFGDQIQQTISSKINEMKPLIEKISADIGELPSKLVSAMKGNEIEIAKVTKLVSNESKSSQELINKLFEVLSEKLSTLTQSVASCEGTLVDHKQECHKMVKATPTTVKEIEKRLLREFHKLESLMSNNPNTKETVENCLETWLIDIQQMMQQNLELMSKKTKTEVNGVVSQEYKKTIEPALRNNLKSISEKVEYFGKQVANYNSLQQESYMQAINDCGFDKVRTSADDCKAMFETKTQLLKQLDGRLKTFIENLSQFNQLHKASSKDMSSQYSGPRSIQGENKTQSTPLDIRSVPALNINERCNDWISRSSERQLSERRFTKIPSVEYHPRTNHNDHLPQTRVNMSSTYPPKDRNDMSSPIAWLQPSPMPSCSRELMKARPDQQRHEKSCASIKPSPVATVKPLVRSNKNFNSGFEIENNEPGSNEARESSRYQLRKRRMGDNLCNFNEPRTRTYQNGTRAKESNMPQQDDFLFCQPLTKKKASPRKCHKENASSILELNEEQRNRSERNHYPAKVQSVQRQISQHQRGFNMTFSKYEEKCSTLIKLTRCVRPDQNEDDRNSMVASEASSPCYSLCSLQMVTPLRRISSAHPSNLRTGERIHPLRNGHNDRKKNLPSSSTMQANL